MRLKTTDHGQALPYAVIILTIVLALITSEALVITERFRQMRRNHAEALQGDVTNWAVYWIDNLAATSPGLATAV